MVSNEPNKITYQAISQMLNIPKDITEVKFINEKLFTILEHTKIKNDKERSGILVNTPMEIRNYEINLINKADIADTKKNLSFLVDYQNFLNSSLEHQENLIKDHLNILTSLIDNVKNMGSVVILLDYFFLLKIRELIYQFIKSHPTTNLLLKFFMVEKTPLLSILCIQKFEQKQIVNLEKMQFILYEVYQNNQLSHEYLQIPFVHLEKTIEYFTEVYSYQIALRKFEKGRVVKIQIRSKEFWEDKTEFTLVIIDSKCDEVASKRNCAAIIVTKNYVNDFLYMSDEGNLILCEQIQFARVILIKPNMFNQDDVNTIKNKVTSYISMFSYEDNLTEKFPIHLVSDSSTDRYEIYRGDGIVIRDVEENKTKELYRQLMFDNNENEIQSEVKLKLSSKVKAKENKFIILPTAEKFASKNLVTCLNNEYISNFYQKCIISGFFLIRNKIPNEKLNVLILGAGIGSLGVYLNEVFGQYIKIDSVEINEKFRKIGKEYFGFKDFEGNQWYFEDGIKFVESRVKENVKYDVIINDINNFNSNEGISPPEVFFEDIFLKNINSLLNDYGMYMINFISRSNSKFNEKTKLLRDCFSKVLYIENNDDLNKIYILFKNVEKENKVFNEYFIKLYDTNLKIFKEHCNIKIIEGDYQRILKRLNTNDN